MTKTFYTVKIGIDGGVFENLKVHNMKSNFMKPDLVTWINLLKIIKLKKNLKKMWRYNFYQKLLMTSSNKTILTYLMCHSEIRN